MKKFNPLVKKGFDLVQEGNKIVSDYHTYLENNYEAKEHTHDFQASTIYKQQIAPSPIIDRDTWILE